jgi:hypothetical protein
MAQFQARNNLPDFLKPSTGPRSFILCRATLLVPKLGNHNILTLDNSSIGHLSSVLIYPPPQPIKLHSVSIIPINPHDLTDDVLSRPTKHTYRFTHKPNGKLNGSRRPFRLVGQYEMTASQSCIAESLMSC